MAYGLPFTALDVLQRLVEVLNSDDEADKAARSEVTDALTANVTTVKGQKKLLNIARKYGWMDETHEQVQLAKEDGAVDIWYSFNVTVTDAVSLSAFMARRNSPAMADFLAKRCNAVHGR